MPVWVKTAFSNAGVMGGIGGRDSFLGFIRLGLRGARLPFSVRGFLWLLLVVGWEYWAFRFCDIAVARVRL